MYIYQVERELIKKAIERNAHYLQGKILDVGAGPYKRYAELFKKVNQYMTLDINPDFKPDIIGKAEEIPLPDNTFDGIICTQVLGDILHPDKVIKEFHRVLKPKGIVLLTEGFFAELHGEPLDFWRFTPYSLSSIFKEKNFKVLKIEKIGGFFTVRAQMVMRHCINSFNLYQHSFWGKFFSKFFKIYGKLAILLDKLDRTRANERFASGYLIIVQKC